MEEDEDWSFRFTVKRSGFARSKKMRSKQKNGKCRRRKNFKMEDEKRKTKMKNVENKDKVL